MIWTLSARDRYKISNLAAESKYTCLLTMFMCAPLGEPGGQVEAEAFGWAVCSAAGYCHRSWEHHPRCCSQAGWSSPCTLHQFPRSDCYFSQDMNSNNFTKTDKSEIYLPIFLLYNTITHDLHRLTIHCIFLRLQHASLFWNPDLNPQTQITS